MCRVWSSHKNLVVARKIKMVKKTDNYFERHVSIGKRNAEVWSTVSNVHWGMVKLFCL